MLPPNHQDNAIKPFALSFSQSQMEALLQNSPDLVYIVDLKSKRLVFVNERVSDILGYSMAEAETLVQKLSSIVIHSDIASLWEALLTRFRLLPSNETAEFHLKLRHKDGSVRTLRHRCRVMTKEGEENTQIMGTAEDVTDSSSRELAYQKNQYQLKEAEVIFKCGSWEWQSHETCMRWSDGLFRVFELSPDQYPDRCIEYKVYESFIYQEDIAKVRSYVRQLLSERRGTLDLEHRIVDAKGVLKYITLRAKCYFDEKGQLARLMGVAADRTEIESYQNELERRLIALKKSNQELEQFAYVASHDLQEPLRKIIAFGERLDKKYKDQLGTEGQFFIARMTNAANRMHGLIEDLLAYSRASRQLESQEPISLNEVAKEVLEDLEVKIQDKKAIVEVDDLPTIEAQSTQMHQLFLNLIENALKFTKPDQAAFVQVKVRKATLPEIKAIPQLNPHQSYFCFTVKDNGIGFEPQYAEQIFAIFQRLHGRSEYEGTGLGLAICRKIVDSHQGYIGARGNVGEGAEFYFYLPHRRSGVSA